MFLFAFSSSNYAIITNISSKGLIYYSSIYHSTGRVNALSFCHYNYGKCYIFLCCSDNIIEYNYIFYRCYDFINNTLIKSFDCSSSPIVIASNELSSHMICGCDNGCLYKINTDKLEIMELYNCNKKLSHIIFINENEIAVSCENDIFIININNNEIVNSISIQYHIISLSYRINPEDDSI